MPLTIRLLGRPRLEDGEGVLPPPRGGKAWGLLAYLVLAEHPATRRRLAGLLFGEADDPLATLRWSLAELRRTIGVPTSLRGDPPALELPPGAVVDVTRVLADEDVPADWLAGELLEGMPFPPAFEAWLSVERRHCAAAAEALMHERAVAGLAAGRHEAAARLATELVGRNPFDEGHHELLVRSLALGGDRTAALARAEECDALFRSELGVAPSPAVRRAAYAARERAFHGTRAAAAAQLEAGQAAASAGAFETAVERLRRACAEAAGCGDDGLRARALVALGETLIHAVRGRDEEGAAVLHQAITVAERAGDRAASATAHRELGYVDVQAGRRERARTWLAKAEALAEGDDEVAALRGVQGMSASDEADYPVARQRLEESVWLAGGGRQAAWSLSLLGRLHLLRGDDGAARSAVDRSLAFTDAERWLAFRPWPDTLAAELEVRAGAVDAAAERLERAFTVACEVEDPCWEGAAARGIGLLAARRGDDAAAREWLHEAVARCTRVPDRYEWAHGFVLEALAAIGDDDAALELDALAARTGMRELSVWALLHRSRSEGTALLESARLLAEDIDNPRLTRALTRPSGIVAS
jgi:DNA-binding SARP family transcriptional activator